MKITDVQPFLMSYPLAEPLRMPFYGGERTIIKRDAMLIRIRTDNGLIGYAPGPAHERAAHEIKDVISPFLLAKDPRRWAEIQFDGGEASFHPEPSRRRREESQTQIRDRRLARDLSESEIRNNQQFLTSSRAGAKGRNSDLIKTYRAVEIALMDAAARYEGCALSEIIGGRKRDRVKLYGSAGMYMSPERFAEEAAAIAKMGFTAYKMRPALGPEQDLETVRRMREAVGPDVGLMIDAHSWWRMGDRSYSWETVAELAGAMAEFKPTWLEEPLPPTDHDAYRKLRASRTVPIATGEHEQDESGFQDLIETGAADYIQMDVCCQGGFAMGQRIFQGVRRKGLRFAFHSWGTALEVVAAAHLGICWSADVVEWLEYPCYSNAGRPGMYPFPLADEILGEPLRIENGDLIVPEEPGLGFAIDESVIEKYPFIPGPWSSFRIDSPPETVAVTGDHSVEWIEAEENSA